MICIDHSERLCKCDPSNHCLVYRYGIDEMEALLDALKARALQLEEWTVRARSALEAKMEKRKGWFHFPLNVLLISVVFYVLFYVLFNVLF